LYPLGLCHFSSQDETSAIVGQLVKRVLPLKLAKNADGEPVDAEGQAALVNTPQGTKLVTVKHNFCMKRNKEGVLEMCLAACAMIPRTRKEVPLMGSIMTSLINWDATSLDDNDDALSENAKGAFSFENPDSPGAKWKYGCEIVAIPLESENMLKSIVHDGHLRIFEPLSSTFELKKNMQICLLACSFKQLLADSVYRGLQSKDYKPQPYDTFALIGTLDYVGKKHIEYTLNTVPGCSGAPIFLLSDDEHHMKLIGTHAGFSTSLGRNFGFLVSPELGI
jgi:hypothetical protein